MQYNVTDFQIKGDGVTNNTASLNLLTKKIRNAGGGTIYFPAGEYITGTIFLYSNMCLELDAGATLLGSADYEDFPMITEVEGYTRNGHWGLISALNCQNITVKGRGTINGRGENWWHKGKSDLVRPRTISFMGCKDVAIEDVTIRNSPCWTVHPMCCENVSVRGVRIYNPYKSPNTDGINPESCKNVRISDCHIDVGDDCVTIKAGTETDYYQNQQACENIIVTNCTMAHGHGGVVIGSEMSGGVKNVTVSNCVFQNTDRGIRLKTRRQRGGCVQGLTFSNITMENVYACITMNCFYPCGAGKDQWDELFDRSAKPVTDKTPKLTDISISGILGRNISGAGIYLYGLPELPVSNVSISNVRLDVTGSEEGVEVVMSPGRPFCHGDGIFLENVKNVEMQNVQITCTEQDLIVKNSEAVMLNGKQI